MNIPMEALFRIDHPLHAYEVMTAVRPCDVPGIALDYLFAYRIRYVLFGTSVPILTVRRDPEISLLDYYGILQNILSLVMNAPELKKKAVRRYLGYVMRGLARLSKYAKTENLKEELMQLSYIAVYVDELIRRPSVEDLENLLVHMYKLVKKDEPVPSDTLFTNTRAGFVMTLRLFFEKYGGGKK